MTIVPCPYCGDVAVCRISEKYKRARVVCLNVEGCYADGPWRKTREEAIRAWNRLALAVQITEAAWLEREAEYAGYASAAKGELVSCARLEKRRLLDQWGEDLDA